MADYTADYTEEQNGMIDEGVTDEELMDGLEGTSDDGRVKKPVFIRLRSAQYGERLEEKGPAFARQYDLEDSLDIDTEGVFYTVNGTKYLLYDEAEEMGMGTNVKTLIRIKPSELEIKRFGTEEPGDMDIRLEKGVRTITRYVAPVQAMNFELEIYTNKLDIDMSDEGVGTIDAEYFMRFDQFGRRKNKLNIKVEANDGPKPERV
ncbi:MAG: DUF1934 domain-containing protein [Mobilibacterium timonense]|uniref:DUF1934 domain-containing protein n=1 Tax=Mobilibacterium timonense TaxID=1871012 RepID=UPI00235632CA|nr:DUF1934 domain-containing protein [Mobilibacterium timonense]MBM6991602.1 DUF1934 domain-containing protein [Mobilibacterium timonense]